MAREAPDLRNLVERLERVEKENRGMKRSAGVLAALLAGALLMGQVGRPAGKVVEAENFIVLDRNGNVRASLDVPQDGRLGLWLRDAAGKPRAVLGVQPNGTPGLVLFDEDEKTRAELVVGLDGTPRLELRDRLGKILFTAP